jgi:hypothetical protein
LLVTSLLSACIIDADQEAQEEPPAPTALPEASEPVAADLALLPAALDGRAAAAEEARKSGAPIAALGLDSSWFSGTIAPGATKGWVWNNAPSTVAFQVGLSPIGASTTAPCKLEVARTFDSKNASGEREFYLYVKNTGTIACGGTVLLGSKTRFGSLAIGGLAPGASKNFLWNNANPTTASHIIGVDPSGATSADDCKMEVTRVWYTQQSSGERELRFTIKNIGVIACQGSANMALADAANSSWSTGVINAGDSKTVHWNNANPLDRIYVPGLAPGGAPFFSPCTLEVTGSYYRQVINTTGSPEREFYFTIKNSGAINCFGTVLLNYVD